MSTPAIIPQGDFVFRLNEVLRYCSIPLVDLSDRSGIGCKGQGLPGPYVIRIYANKDVTGELHLRTARNAAL
ncbi:unnamed protein product [Fusarium graminearum]|uniref:Uncharacterized protein n=1 Tax=Gibberella zeae TaxID=5518 RepID=A0A9N8RL92_GIBZA|nr:unnamed protein product [Fusarium graminearum]